MRMDAAQLSQGAYALAYAILRAFMVVWLLAFSLVVIAAVVLWSF